MSRSVATTPSEMPSDAPPALLLRQVQGILRLELRKQLFSRRSLLLYFLGFAPLLMILGWLASSVPREFMAGPIDATQFFAFFYSGYLSTSVFLSCLILFMSLFRAEILEKSLHYYYLTPVRREVIVAGKYVAALIATGSVFTLSTAILYLGMMSPWGLGELSRHLFHGPGLSHLLTYVGVALLACLGYGAVFLLAGQVFRNPVVAALILWAWESINFFLPSMLKKLSVFFYLWSLLPIHLSAGPFAVLAEPTPAWIAVPGLLLFTVGVLAFTGWRARRMEITYGVD